MASVNKVILIGNLGRDPELRYTKAGGAVCNFSIATSEKWKDKQSGDMKERTEWHRIVTWNIQAENCAQYLAKGRSVYVEGSLQTRKWEVEGEATARYTTEIHAQSVQFLGGNHDAEQQSESQPQRGKPDSKPPNDFSLAGGSVPPDEDPFQ